MLGVWYPTDLLGPGVDIPSWVFWVTIVAFLLGGAAAVWVLRGR
jgi:hypothetical protein